MAQKAWTKFHKEFQYDDPKSEVKCVILIALIKADMSPKFQRLHSPFLECQTRIAGFASVRDADLRSKKCSNGELQLEILITFVANEISLKFQRLYPRFEHAKFNVMIIISVQRWRLVSHL